MLIGVIVAIVVGGTAMYHARKAPVVGGPSNEIIAEAEIPVVVDSKADVDILGRNSDVDSGVYRKLVLNINDNEFVFQYKPNSAEAKPLRMAMKFCDEHGTSLGFPGGDHPDCFLPLEKEIQRLMHEDNPDAVEAPQPKKTEKEIEEELAAQGIRRVPLDINGITYVFEYHMEMSVAYAAEHLAQEFCKGKGVEVVQLEVADVASITPEMIHEKCTLPLIKELEINIKLQLSGKQ